MKTASPNRVPPFIIHLIIWLLYAAVHMLVYVIAAKHPSVTLVQTVQTFLICAVIFYGNSELLLPFLVERKKYLLYACMLLLLFMLNAVLRYLIYVVINPQWLGLEAEATNNDMYIFLVRCSWWWFQSILLSFGYWFAKVSIRRKGEVSAIRTEMALKEVEQLMLKQEKLELENEVLKAQINPHFLFNTLGYFYNKTRKIQPEIAEGIFALTNIIRSSIKKSGIDGFIFLEEEVENIEHLINIYKMRFNNSVFIHFEKKITSNEARILPHILITLVENAFKHGDMQDPQNPLTIKIEVSKEQILFYIHNKKRFGPKEISNGIGLNYVVKHLGKVYPDKHTLMIDDLELTYTLHLHISHDDVFSEPVLKNEV